jgi:hypothetical protein
MAITGNLLASVGYTGARKWGTGVNPVHATPTEGEPLRSSEVTTATGPNAGDPNKLVPEMLLNPLDENPEYGYTDEEFSSMVWGYGPSTGTSDRPARDVMSQQFRGYTTKNWPKIWQNDPATAPGGAGPPTGETIRQESHGDYTGSMTKLGDKEETVGEGWINKDVAGVADAVDSDPAQVYMQTSMTQRDKVRAGSQRGAGSASEYDAPIGSWRPTWGMRVKPWSGGRRHYDMTPRRQDQINRPFWYRAAGTGYRQWMAANEAFNYQVEPLQRQPVADPYAGTRVPDNVYTDESHNWVDAWY